MPSARSPIIPPAPRRVAIGPLTPHLYVPSAERPLRAKLRHLSAATRVVPHRHPWAQLALSTTGVVRLTVDHGSFIVPPSRALWIPPGVEHAVTVVEDAELRTVYLHQGAGRCGPGVARADEPAWRRCRVLEVSALLRALVVEMDVAPDGAGTPPDRAALERERRIGALVLDELRRARALPLGVALPADKRLRARDLVIEHAFRSISDRAVSGKPKHVPRGQEARPAHALQRPESSAARSPAPLATDTRNA